jgi:molybdenum cofactor cytidylyltransferase
MDLGTALGMRTGEMLALVGAGGKTTTGWLLLRQFVEAGSPVVFSTTTHIFEPRDAPCLLNVAPPAEDVRAALRGSPMLFLAARRGEAGDARQAAHSAYPAHRTKLVGLAPQMLGDLVRHLPGVTWVVEADGARGLLLKAPAAHEPVIPGAAGRVVVVAGMGAIGRPLDARTVHRPEIAARLLGLPLGARITPLHVAQLVGHAGGGLKGIPAQAQALALLALWGGPSPSGAGWIAQTLLAGRRFSRVILADLQAADPVRRVWE